jgi:hypothetical protein
MGEDGLRVEGLVAPPVVLARIADENPNPAIRGGATLSMDIGGLRSSARRIFLDIGWLYRSPRIASMEYHCIGGPIQG